MVYKRLPLNSIMRKLKEDDRVSRQTGSVRPMLSKAVTIFRVLSASWRKHGLG